MSGNKHALVTKNIIGHIVANLPVVALISALCFSACVNSLPPSSPTLEPTQPLPAPTEALSSPSSLNPTPVVNPIPTDQYSRQDNFGDGYIARIPIQDVQGSSPEEIVKLLVAQWLEHYKTASQAPDATIEDYEIREVSLMDNTINPGYEIVAGVLFSIIPTQELNQWGGFPIDEADQQDIWGASLWAPFGVFREGENFRLRLVFGWGT